MSISRLSGYGFGLLPGFTVAVVALGVAYVLGGEIAAAIVGFLTVSAFFIDAVLCLWLLRSRPECSRARSVVLGSVFYVASVIAVVVLFSLSGQSQIM